MSNALQPGRKPRLLVILSTILGLRQVSAYLRRELASHARQWDIEFIVFSAEHYRTHRVFASWNPWKNRFETAYCARALLEEVRPEHFDAYLVVGQELLHGASVWTRGKPVVLYIDSTDRLAHAQVAARDSAALAGAKRAVKDMVTRPIYGPLLDGVTVALAESEWCAASLQRDYGFTRERIRIAAGALDLAVWCPPTERARDQGAPARLLFVGNDFERKGGPFLLDVFSRLREKATLTIVSSDDTAATAASVPGVTVRRGIDHDKLPELVTLYQQSDLLLFPTWIDKLPNVVREACATGLPIVARDCGGIGTVVQDDVTGRLLPYHSSVETWVDAIDTLLGDDQRRERMRKASRALAEEVLSRDNLAAALTYALERCVPSALTR